MSEDALRTLALQVRNWGKWGPNDELGTLNYITPETIAEGCRLATAGKIFALGIPLQREGPQSGTRQRFNPIHAMFRDGGDRPRTPEHVRDAQGDGRRPEGGGQTRRPAARSHRPHDALSGQERLARLRPGQFSWRVDPHRAVAARAPDRRDRQRQLRGGGPALGDAPRVSQPLPRPGHPQHGPDAR